jgi:hypothetical protein
VFAIRFLKSIREDRIQMKLFKTIVTLCALSAATAYAVDPVKLDMTCAELGETHEFTAEAKERFAEFAGTCEGVYEVNGAMYVRAQAVIRRVSGNNVRLYLPATDHTFQTTADPTGRVWVGGRKVRVRSLSAGDEIGIYLSVDKFAEERLDEVAFATADDSEEAIVIAPVEEVAALPTTATQLPLIALLSTLLLAGGLLMRKVRQ